MASPFLIPTAAMSLLLLLLSPPLASGFVVDTDGDPLANGGTYYILPNKPGANPLAYTTLTWPTSLPFYITESGNFSLEPAAVRVSLSSPIKFPFIRVSEPVTLQFETDNKHPFCKDLSWFLSLSNFYGLRAFVNVCGQEVKHNELVIDAAEGSNFNVYNLSFCYNNVDGKCADRLEVGMLELGGPDFLYVGYNPRNPLPVVFQKVDHKTSSSV